MVNSMTGFAQRDGSLALAAGEARWSWDIRAVNGRGLDLRLRLPDGVEGLEPAVRAALGAALARGSVSLSLRLIRPEAGAALRVVPEALAAALAALQTVEAEAARQGVSLVPSSAVELMGLRGVLDSSGNEGAEETEAAAAEAAALKSALLADLAALISDLAASRAGEGARIGAVLATQTERIAALVAEARQEAEARRPAAAAALREALARVLETAQTADPGRLEQELALIAVRQDVSEELDRLEAHVAAARALLADAAPVGRKLDFLMQEFNREANTLCSKAQSPALTRIGLDLKVAIDQMREQVQNVE